MNDGYIKLYRQIAENPLWKEKPFTRGQAWVDLLLKANFKDCETYIKGKRVLIKRGQTLRAVENLAYEWGWSPNKVRRFILDLTLQGMIKKIGTPNGTLITIENYETFQDERRADERPDGRPDERPDERPDGRGEKKEKKEKKDKKERGAFAPPSLGEVSKYVDEMGYSMDPAAFYDYYSGTGWIRKNGQRVRDWKATVRTWERREKEFAKKDKPRTGNAPIEPPKYPELKPEPEVKGEPMPDEIRERIDKLFS